MIFKNVADVRHHSYYEELEVLRLAYKSWAKLIDGHPSFWTSLRYCDPDDLWETVMERSEELPLDVHLTGDSLEEGGPGYEDRAAAFLETIENTSSRWRSLHVRVASMEACQVQTFIESSAANLEKLDVVHTGGSFELRSIFDSGVRMPRLQTLSLTGCRSWGAVAFPELRILRLESLNGDVAGLVEMLETCPLLEDMVVYDSGFITASDARGDLDETLSRVTLPHLRSLTLSLWNPDLNREILARLHAPQISSLRVACGGRGSPLGVPKFERLLASLHRWLRSFPTIVSPPRLNVTISDTGNITLAHGDQLEVAMRRTDPSAIWKSWMQMVNSLTREIRVSVTELAFCFADTDEVQIQTALSDISLAFPNVISLSTTYQTIFRYPGDDRQWIETVLKCLGKPHSTGTGGKEWIFPKLRQLKTIWLSHTRDLWFSFVKARLHVSQLETIDFGESSIHRTDYEALVELGVSVHLDDRGIIQEVSAAATLK